MANLRMTFGAAMSTVGDALTTVSTVTNVATKSDGLLDAFVTDASQNQQIRMRLRQSSTIERLIEETALEDTERQLKIKKYLSDNPDSAGDYKKNQERLQKVLESIKN